MILKNLSELLVVSDLVYQLAQQMSPIFWSEIELTVTDTTVVPELKKTSVCVSRKAASKFQ